MFGCRNIKCERNMLQFQHSKKIRTGLEYNGICETNVVIQSLSSLYEFQKYDHLHSVVYIFAKNPHGTKSLQ